MARMFGRALKTRVAIQTAYADYATGPYTPVHTYSRGDAASPPMNEDPLLGEATANDRDPVAPAQGRFAGTARRRVPLCLSEIGFWLHAAFGDPVTTGTDNDFVHVFTSGGTALRTLTVQDHLGGTMFRHQRGVVVNGFSLEAKKGDDFPALDLDLLMRDQVKAAAWLEGTPDPPLPLLRPRGWHCAVAWNDAPIGHGAEVTLSFSNNCERDDAPDGTEFASGIDPMLASYGGSLQLRTEDESFFDLAAAGGAAGKLALAWTHPSDVTNRRITITLNAVRLTTEGQPVEGAGALTANFTLRGEQTALLPAMTVELKNAVASYLPA